MKTVGSFVPQAHFVLGTRLEKKGEKYIVEYMIINIRTGKKVAYVKAHSRAKEFNMMTFVGKSISRLLGLSSIAEVEVDTVVKEESNTAQLIFATGIFSATALYLGAKWGLFSGSDKGNFL
jgi:hypothetical protein